MNKCDECKENLVKTYIISEFGLPITVWVCERSEIYQLNLRKHEKKYFIEGKKSGKSKSR